MGAATHLSFSVQPAGYTSEGVLTTQPVVQALDAGNAVDTTFSGKVTLTPSVATSQFYTTTEKFKTTHTVQSGSTSSALILSPALTFDASLPANYSGIRAGVIGTSGTLNGRTGLIASNTGTTQINMVAAFSVTPTAGDTVVIRSGVMFDSIAVNAVAGVATFSGLSLSGHEATALIASASGLTGATSNTLSPTGTFVGRAELPRVTVDTSQPTYDPTVYTLNPANLTDASPNWKTFNQCITDLVASDTGSHRLVLVQGGTYNEFVTLKNRTAGMGWITFRWNANPLSAGVRATATNLPGCPKITTKDNNAGVMGPQTYSGGNVVHHYRFEGIELAVQTPTSGTAFVVGQVFAFWDGVGSTSAGMPHHVGFDQCWLHAGSGTSITRGIYVGGTDFFLVNSSITETHLVGNDSQAIIFAGTCGAGHKVTNNYLEAAGEIIMTGGADTPAAGLVCSDVTLMGNHFRRPIAWKAPWNGSNYTYTDQVQWTTKNLLEFKSGVRWRVEGNTFENEWPNAQNAALVFGSASQSGTSPWQGNRDVVFRYNGFRNVCQWAVLSGENPGGSGGAASQVLGRRVEVLHNLIVHNNADTAPTAMLPDGNPRSLQIYNGIRALRIEHNTILADPVTGASFFYLGAPALPDGICQYNLVSFPYYGSLSDTWYDDDIFANAFPSGRLKNVLLDYDATHAGAFSLYTATNPTWEQSTAAAVGFADAAKISGTAERAATFLQLASALTLTSGSYAGTNWTGDGQNVGADMTALASAIASSFVAGEGTSLDGVEPGASGSATQLLLSTQPSGAVSGNTLTTQPSGTVADSGGSTVTSDTSTVTASWVLLTGDAVPTGTLTTTASSGAWSFSTLGLSWSSPSTGYWHFTDGSLTSVNSSTMTLSVAIAQPSLVLPTVVDQWRPTQRNREGLEVVPSASPLIGTGGTTVANSGTTSVLIPVGRVKVSVLSLSLDAMTAAGSSGTVTVQAFKVSGGVSTALTNALSIKTDVISAAGNVSWPVLTALFDGPSNGTRRIDGTKGDTLRVDVVASGTITQQPQVRVVAELAVNG